MKFSAEWTKHSPDIWPGSKCKKWINCEPDCECGIKERHQHCDHCGLLVSKGDWEAPPIAEYWL